MRRLSGGALLSMVLLPAQASHPLLTTSPDVLGKGRSQFELKAERARGGAAMTAVELAHGVADRLEATIETRYLRGDTDEGVRRGLGDTALALKWRFFDRGRFALALIPEVLIPTGREAHGLGAGRTGWATSLVGSYGFGRLELLGAAGYERNRNRLDEPDPVRSRSAALLWSATEDLRLGVDLVREGEERSVVYAFLYEVSEAFDFGAGLQRGRGDAAPERALLIGARFRW
ncbi:MAG TPA: transporter [Burkholderiales bacterium]|nr:transporter [Burkholderiales bacterium]